MPFANLAASDEGRATITAVPQEEEVGLVPMKQLVAQMDYQARKLV